MWKCLRCDESVEDDFEVCWNCCAQRDPNAEFIDSEPEETIHAPRTDRTEPPEMQLTGRMDRREIATIICKTLALLMFSQAAFFSITALVMVTFMIIGAPFDGRVDWHELWVTLILVIPLLATLIVGWIYWRNAYAIATKMVSPDPTPVTTYEIDVKDIMMVAFSSAGVFILVDGVREVAGVLFIAQQYEYSAIDFWYNSNTWSALVQLTIGVWLILGSRGIVNVIHWARTAGTPAFTDDDDRNDAR